MYRIAYLFATMNKVSTSKPTSGNGRYVSDQSLPDTSCSEMLEEILFDDQGKVGAMGGVRK